MPLPTARRAVKLQHEDSSRYSLYAPETHQEWLWTATAGDGNVHYGPGRRLFVVAVTHELHCLRSYRAALAQDAVPHGHHQLAHLTHCLNFFRTSTLCAADTTLEPPDAFARNYTSQRAGGVHRCMDWPAFYDEMGTNYREWDAFQQQQAEAARTGM